ncbi:MAG: type II toxin-antitoxin system HicA family toxin [Deinococcota bacterium]|jgi:predicted RNA binding protein YcfA (HicA-like mRNA interferase family)|nr:type II toxin-antitoxin system HicA family toxin [Deinococcota bacterium]
MSTGRSRRSLRRRVAERLTRCDWSEFLALAEAYGFELKIGKGSRRKLIHDSGVVVSVHEPHPRKRPVHPEAAKALLRATADLEENHEDQP